MNKKFKNKDTFLGKDVLTLANKISSSRTIMFSSQMEQALCLDNPEFPKVFTSYENETGSYSSAYKKANKKYKIIGRVNKFSFQPDLFYTLILEDEEGNFDVVERKEFEKLTESYCYKYNNEVIDKKQVEDEIEENEVIYRSNSFDKHMNYRYGINANVCYLVENNTIEDAIIISESFAKKMSASFVSEVEINVNKNDILCNLYYEQIKEVIDGEEKKYDYYKCFPEVGETIKNGILASRRRINYEHGLFDLQTNNLKKVNYKTDVPFYGKGKVVDIDIYCNQNIEDLSKPYEQIVKYLKEQERYCNEFLDIVVPIIKQDRKKCSEDLLFMYKRCKDIVNKKYKWNTNQSEFDSIIINIKVLYSKELKVGSKLTGRFGK